MTKELQTKALLDLNRSIAGKHICGFTYPWEALPGLREYIHALLVKYSDDERFCMLTCGVLAAKSAKIANSAIILPPAFIDENAEIRTGAYLRGSVIIGKECVVGNSSEVKNSVLFDCAAVPHFNYVGDSILGASSHMGAGAVTSNLKMDKSPISVRYGDKSIETGLRKFGAILGDCAEIGCNCVLNPGTIIGRCTNIYPLSSVRGVIPANAIYKDSETTVIKHMHKSRERNLS